MIAELSTALHKLPSEAEQITIADCADLYRHWERSPHAARAAAMQLAATTTWKPKEKPKPFKESSPEDFAAFAQALGVPLQQKKG